MKKNHINHQRFLYLFFFLGLIITNNFQISLGSIFENKINQLRISQDTDQAGIIALWSGPLNTIPAGWKILDGSDGTLNTTDRFLCSTNGMEVTGAIGGSISHNHSFSTVPYHDHGATSITTNEHRHSYVRPNSYRLVQPGTNMAIRSFETITGGTSTFHSHNVQPSGGTNLYMSNENHIPPYYKMAFIMKESNITTIPIGLIVMWVESIENIPTGWSICDGTNGTPDLRGNFIRGILQDEDPGASGGNIFHNHTYTEIPTHSHSIDRGGNYHHHKYYGATCGVSGSGLYTYSYSTGTTEPTSVPHTHNINEIGLDICKTHNAENLPPYYKIAFIMNKEVSNTLPSGAICMWGDTVMTIPSGWNHTNGENNTPNLLNRFPQGETDGEQIGIIGGSNTHSHIYTEIPKHIHIVESNPMTHSHTMDKYPDATATIPASPASEGYYVYYSSGSSIKQTFITTLSHSHDINPTGSTTPYTSYENNLPPFVKLIFMQKNISNQLPEDGIPGEIPFPVLIPIGLIVIVTAGIFSGIFYMRRKKRT